MREHGGLSFTQKQKESKMAGIDDLLKRLRENSEPVDPVELYATLDNEYRDMQTIHDAEKSGLKEQLKEAEEKAKKEAAEKSRIQALLVQKLMDAPVEQEEGDKAHASEGKDTPPKPSGNDGIMSLFKKVK